MSNLVIDVGNTRIKAALFEDNHLMELYAPNLAAPKEFLSWVAQANPERVIISDVSGEASPRLLSLLVDFKVLQLSSSLLLPFTNCYGSKQTLGADRMALVAGATHFFEKQPCLIIDAGTCITYDVIDEKGNYWGGNITPGLQMRLKAMHTFTGKLPQPEFVRPAEVMGNNTVACLLSGVYYGIIGEIEYLAAHYTRQYPALRILLTGGDAQPLAKSLKTGIFAQEHLLLYGLNKILRINA